MKDLERRIAALDPARRRLLEERLRAIGTSSGTRSRIARLPEAPHHALSFGQQRLWFIDRLIAGSPAYNIPFAGRLHGPLNVSVLERAVTEIVRRHEILRTSFPVLEGQAVQRVGPAGPVPVEVDDLTPSPPGSREEHASRLVDEEARVPFDLERGPVLRVRLARLAPEDHVLLVTMPHIVTDAWSMAVFFRELPALYDAFAAGRASPLPELPIQFRDFAAWQRDQLGDGRMEALLATWTRRLAEAPTVLELPADRPRPAAQTFGGARAVVDLPRATTRALEALAQGEGATPFMAYLAAFAVLLHHWSGQEDLLVGSPVATREAEETHGLIGFFINTLVFRIELRGDPTFRALLRQARETCVEAYANQDLPFERLVEALGLERDLSRAPLTQATLVLQNVHIPPPEFRNLNLVSFQQTGTRTAKFDLMLGLWESPGGIEGWWEYSTDLFEPETIARLSARFRALLEEIVKDPDRRLSQLPRLPRDERARIEAWSCDPAPDGRLEGLKEVFERRSAEAPEAIAVSYEDTVCSYAELNRRANRIARYLRRAGLEDESPVGVLLPRSVAAVEAILGIVKAGGAYVPLDPADPPARLACLVAETGCRWILTDENGETKLREGTALSIRLDRERDLIAGESPENPAWHTRPEQLLYVMFTSGSTGTPKGIAVPHRAVTRLVFGQGYAELGPDGVHLLLAPLAFDASTFELWGALLHGSRLAVFPEEIPVPPRLRQVIAREGVRTLWLTAGLFHLLADEAPDLFRPLRRVLAGGDVLSPAHVRRVLEHNPGLVLVNGYGPTEGTTFTCCHAMSGPEAVSAPVPIGRPLRNTRVAVLDASGGMAPIGVPGELWIGGDGLARGYHMRPAWTAERFLPDPTGGEPGARLYRTGDLARWRSDGTLEFLGRRDRQVKLRGYRIELDEVEAALSATDSVREGAVELHTDEDGAKRLVAYVVLAPGEPADPVRLLSSLGGRIPDYMVPQQIVFLDALPLTPNGKLDRRALPAPPRPGESVAGSADAAARDETAPARDDMAPREPIETALAGIWADVLGLDRVGLHDDFFALGGDSIRAILVLARAHEAGIRISPRQLFEHRTVSALAAVGLAARESRSADQGPVVGPMPPLPIQRWFFSLEIPDRNRWNMGLRLTARERLDPAALARALEAVLLHHDALRLRVRRAEPGWELEIAPPGEPASLRVIEEDGEAGPEPRLRQVTAELHGSLDLERGPALAAALVRGEGADTLLLVVHHLAVDAVSWRILLEDLERAYEQALRGENPSLPPKTASIRAWSERLRAHAQSDLARSELGHWLSTGSGPMGTTWLPADHVVEEDVEASSREIRVALDAERTSALAREALRAYRSEVSDFLLAALVDALERAGGERALLVDIERHGREALFDDLDIARTIGWFTAIVPARLDLRDAREPDRALRVVKEQLRGIPRGGIGHGILRWLGAPEDSARLARLTQAPVSFNYLGAVDAMLRETRLFADVREAGGPSRDPAARRAYPLEITAWIREGRLHMAFVHGAGHRRETVERLASEFESSLGALIAHASAPGSGGATPSDFPRARISQSELDRLLARIGAGAGGGDAR